ncbi:PKD domain-containing protein [Chloroflexota bacterium]
MKLKLKPLVYVLSTVIICALFAMSAPMPSVAAYTLPESYNTLRLYGEDDHNALFPYVGEQDPFDITSENAPDKDFLVWNPAYMYHMDDASNNMTGDDATFFQKIVVNGDDANEKVHLRQWYVPEYSEPAGNVWTSATAVDSADIVMEYTYLLMDTSNNPVYGRPTPQLTSFIFPIADNDDEQKGLDSYDAIVDDDILANETILNYFWGAPGLPRPPHVGGNAKTIDVSTTLLTIEAGQSIQFLDHRVEVVSLATDSAMVKVYYGGNDVDSALSQTSMSSGDLLTAGRHAIHVDSSWNPTDATTWNSLRPIVEPWYLDLVDATSTEAFVRVGRLIQYGETFFVDCVEYDVAQLWGQSWGTAVDEYILTASENCTPYELKYITIRNPIPKEEVLLEELTITKCAQADCPELMPFLPPFNMVHDIIDDVNIPEESSNGLLPDEQSPDNIIPDLSSSDDDYIAEDYDSIVERRVEDQLPAEMCWLSETKEPRFDQNLLEEKFTADAAEDWRWINIETMPWDYTEFVLPEWGDIPTETDYTTGDYILVSSFLAPNSGTGVRVKFCYDAEVGIVHSKDIYVNDYTEYNTLRLYGEDSHNALFPYVSEQDPFDITSENATDKDFLVWNPAYMYHMDDASNNMTGDDATFFQKIVVNGDDANEKVHLRQWYVPEYTEPAGNVWTSATAVDSADIVMEYTYLLMDTSNNPVYGRPTPQLTSFIFPIADNDDEQKGLDSYDAIVDDDILANETILNYFWGAPGLPRPPHVGGNAKTIDVSTTLLTIEAGQSIQFLDHRVEVVSLATDSAMVKVYYGGNDVDSALSQTSMSSGDLLTAGRHAIHVDSSWNPTDATTWNSLRPIVEPWYLDLVDATSTEAFVRVGRLIQYGETFFVDCVEYDVAQLWGQSWGTAVDEYILTASENCTPYELKYITIRNPIPKEEVLLEELTITKCAQADCPELMPFLPPFNMVHDIIDDVNIPEESSNGLLPDEQSPDNIIPDLSSSDDDYIAEDYDSIVERRVEDQLPAEMCWLEETKEPRFDQNLLEEKFTADAAEDWRWINIETMPWDYTEFILPEWCDIPTETDYTTGDYILVSSFLAPNSGTGVRVKFCYDATNGTGIYVNSFEEEVVPEPLVADCGGPYSGEVDEDIAISGSASGGVPGYTYAWDLDEDGQYDDDTGASITNSWSTAGTKTVGLEVTDTAMSTATTTCTVEVSEPVWDPWDYDADDDDVISITEVLAAISDYFSAEITITEVLEVIGLYFS